MRLARLNLLKFAMFTDAELELLPDGVNVIIGANEAGKTTTMAAIRQWLYGIPVRSNHSYLHANADLRVGGLLRDNTGVDHEIYRIKRNSGSLRSATDAPIDEAVLVELLGGVEADVYATLFSISHEEIVSGGRALLSSEGELGRALFGAGTGLTQLNAVMSDLDARAGELFKSGASKPLINSDIAKYKDLAAAIKDHAQSASAVEQLDKALAQAEQRHGTLDREFQELSANLARATRARSVRSQVQQRRQSKQELADLDAVGPRVPPGIPPLLAEAQEAHRAGSSSLATLVPDLERLAAKLAVITVDESLLAQGEVIEELVEQLGGLRLNLKDLPSLNKQVGDLERDIEGLMRRVPAGCRMDPTGLPAISDVERSRIERLGTAWITIDGSLTTARQSRDAAQRSHTEALADLAKLPDAPDASNLRRAVARVRGEGQLESTVDSLDQQITKLLNSLEATISGLGLTVDARDADKLAVPSSILVNEVDRRISAAQSAADAALKEKARLDEGLARFERQLSELLHQSDPPSLEQLDTTRAHRDEGWRLIRAVWLENATVEDEVAAWADGQPLDQAYESAVRTSDDVGDRLRREAETVERRTLLEQQISDQHQAIAHHEIEIETVRTDHEAATADWQALWTPLGVDIANREAADEFLATTRELGTNVANLRKLESEAAAQRSTILRCAADLRGLLAELGDRPDESLSLLALLERSDDLCTKADDAHQARILAEQSLQTTKTQLDGHDETVKTAEAATGDWDLEWAEAITPLGVPTTTDPSDVADLLATLKAIEEKSTDLDEKRRRVAGMERRNLDIDGRVAEVLAALPHLSLDATDTEVTINSLQRLLRSTEKEAATRESLLSQHASKDHDVEQAKEKVATAEADIDGLISQAGVADEQALVEAVERTNRSALLVSEIDRLQSDLIESTGLSLEQLELEVDQFVDVDLDTMIGDLADRRDLLDQERNDAALEVGGLRNDKKMIDDSDEAAVAAERAQSALASVSNHADDYVRVTLARYLLEQQVADYRAKNQGPILGRASEFFRQLTLDRYSGLDTDADDKGQPIILATRPVGGSLDVSNLSTGTRDQLYLSLRLAALEHYAVGSRNLPLLLDDLFVHFDDERTSAGLAVLEELSSKMQVLLFTHHERVATQAAEAIAGDKLKVQVLAAG